jgi:uncharacterized repeat protein (TIGR01451 family)
VRFLSSFRVLAALAVMGLVAAAGAAPVPGAVRTPHAVTLKLLAHDVSRPLRSAPHASRPHVRPHRSITLRPSAIRTPLAVLLGSTQRAARALNPATVSQSDGIPQPGAWAPADANGDIGRTQFVQAVNLRLAVFSRTNAHPRLALVTSAEFWAGLAGTSGGDLCTTSPGGDPAVAYDDAADRWVVTEFAFGTDSLGNPVAPYVQCVAVSTSPDATGTWNRYVFEVSTTKFPDYPKLGVWQDGYYLSFNQFDATGWAGAGAMALERSQMLTGGTAQARYFDLGTVYPGLGGMLPASQDGNNAPSSPDELYTQVDDDPSNFNDRLEIWAFHVDWAAPAAASTFTPVVPLSSLAVTAFDSIFSCPKPGTATEFWSYCIEQALVSDPGLDPVSDANVTTDAHGTTIVPQLMYRLQYTRAGPGGKERLVVAHTVNLGANLAGVRWYELANVGTGWYLAQQGTYGGAGGSSRFMGSASVNGQGQIGIAYNISGGGLSPGVSYTGHDPADAPGVYAAEASLGAGAASQLNSNRWGDYSSLTLDPIDECTFWFTGEYGAAGGWSTRIGSFQLDTVACGGITPAFARLTGDPTWTAPIVREGQTITGSPGTFTGATSTSYQWRRCDRYGMSCTDLPGQTALTHVITAADANGSRSLRFTEIAAGTVGDATAVSTPTAVVQSLPPVNTTLPAISGVPKEGVTLTASTGTWTSSSPLSYIYDWRRCTGGTCTSIPGGDQSTYIPVGADVGATLEVLVSATNTGGAVTARSAQTAAVAPTPAVIATLPTISGTAQLGQQLTATSGSWTGSGPFTYAYSWERCSSTCTATGGTGTTYTIAPGDVGGTIRVVVTASNSGGSNSAASAPTAVITGPPSSLTLPVISGTVQEGQALTVSTGSWSGSQPITYAYQWERCTSAGSGCLAIAGATSGSYTLTALDVGSTMRAVVTATNSVSSALATSSTSTAVVALGGTTTGGGGGGGGGSSGALDLAVTMYGAPTPTDVGGTLYYYVTVTNASSVGASAVYVDFTLPANVTVISTYTDRGAGACFGDTKVLTCSLDFLPARAVATIAIAVKVNAKGQLVAKAAVRSTEADSNAANNIATSTIGVGLSTTTGLNGQGSDVPTGPDKVVPKVRALGSSGRHGRQAALRYKLYDDRGVARATLTVKRGGKVLGSSRTGFGPVVSGTVYYFAWKVPASVRGALSFCIIATDRTGNASTRSCAPFSVK